MRVVLHERTDEVYLPMNRFDNGWLPVKADAHQSWPPKNEQWTMSNPERQREKETAK